MTPDVLDGDDIAGAHQLLVVDHDHALAELRGLGRELAVVRNDDVDIIDRVAGFIEHFLGNVRHRAHRDLEKLVAFHLEEMIAGSERFSCWFLPSAATR